jgi:uncharacterized glyoxalase superfamily protein PhnB
VSADKSHWYIAPYFLVDDVVSTANWYRDKLGFSYNRFWGEPESFCMVHRRSVTIMLSQSREERTPLRPNNSIGNLGIWDAYLWIDDADAYMAELKSRGVEIDRDICDREYEMRDFEIVDPNGYRLCFGHNISK